MDAILFDLNGVILKEGRIISQIALPLISGTCDYETVKKEYLRYSSDEISRNEFWKNLNVKEPEKIEKQLLESFELSDYLLEILEKLKGKYHLGVLSNEPKEWYEYVSKKFEFEKYFDSQTISYEEKIRKPDKRIFETALSKVNANKIYFIDDMLKNLKAASEFGIIGILFSQYKGKLDLDDALDFEPKYKIDSFKELENILYRK